MKRDPVLLCLVQLPPPVHGAALMNEFVVNSDVVARGIELDVLPMEFATSIDDIQRLSSRKILLAVKLAWRLMYRLAAHKPDALYFTFTPAGAGFFRDCLYVAIAKAAGVPCILHLHGKGLATYAGRGLRRRLRDMTFANTRVIVLAERLRSEVAAVPCVLGVYVVANGIPDILGTSERTGEPRILYLSTMVEDKGPLVLLEALALLAQRGIHVDATFAGPNYRGCVARFERRVRELGLTERVRYIGPVFGEDKNRLFATHHIFVLPSRNDAFPLVVLEAMRAGMPVVATAQGGVPEMVADGENGYVVNAPNADDFADRLATLVSNSALRERLGAESRRRFAARFTIDAFETRIRDVLTNALAMANVRREADAACP